MQVHSGKLLDQYYKMLPDVERQYVREGANDKVRKERLLARTLVRAVLIRYESNCSACHTIFLSFFRWPLSHKVAASLPLLQRISSCLSYENVSCGVAREWPSRYCKDGTPSQELQFECSPAGKPWLVSEQGKDREGGQLHFNLTHTDRLLGTLYAL